MDTAFTRALGIELPIVQAPMGGATCPALAAAVSEAGGLGMLALSWHPLEAARAEIRATRALTGRPFGINLVLAFPQDERLEACLEAGVRLVSFFWGDPAPFVGRVHAAGALAAATVASAEEARRAVDAGVDVIVAQGWEAGGHVRGEVATLPLVRAVVRAVGPQTPVLAAGGIADGHGLAAALALGAAGAWVGTRFLAAEEAAIHADYRRRLFAADETATAHTSLFDVGWPDAPHRVLRNSTLSAWEAAGRPAAGARPGEGEVLASAGRGRLVRYGAATPGPDAEGDIEALSLWAGQGVACVTAASPAAAIVRELADEARDAARALAAALA
jgi:NAD(P)H-dependent flavin oxidoreductase YrpB (nitropropane dioxygenase family)